MGIDDIAMLHAGVKVHDVFLVNIYNSIIREGTSIGAFTEISGAKVGRNCSIQAHVFIPPGTIIYDNVFIGPGVRFCNVKYPDPMAATPEKDYEGAIVLEGAAIGANSTILPGCIIGKRAFIGAGSVLTGNARPYGLYYGNPAEYMGKTYNKCWPNSDPPPDLITNAKKGG